MRSIKDWDCAADNVDDSEVFLLHDLDEFESTEFNRVIRTVAPTETQSIESHKRKPPESAATRLLKKRQNVSDISLHKIIPGPHFCPPPDVIPQVPVPKIGLKKYLSENAPFPIPPHNQGSIRDALSDEYARSAWIVPIRGKVPWRGCSAATVLEPKQASKQGYFGALGPRGPHDPAPNDNPDSQIVWTHDALVAFWAFLLQLRAGGALGPLSLSFDVARTQPEPSTSSTTRGVVVGHAVDSTPNGPGSTARTSSSNPSQDVRSTLLGMDHFKIYHDTRYTINLRHVLYAWSYEPRHSEAVEEIFGSAIPKDKIRMFKYARLVLLDERSKAILNM
ncbi:uncharacterized protein B0H18DRAFT_71441 [Fomitopsis serialis]|uniref:uncharacterized protein n=1 Tax=Fomitopsis serialis TaxID=139415 RepID=UPI0020085D83|nr:uncharacterized protein B0H18DRAFT_71441 [Neoantrodia serialis]KAH9931945.1 hypothetical protein B0H18DRAFT_71441 [Neoantrodia serialis]